ncbi:hypothetical protein Ait01nite_089760 [Actinoplanes italicus]|uniref:Uncharacterized protein n=2 Tax=Actinoplanes italicus TaxID=113567 RepID=A0A2T0JIE4_9ACTN|nr:hypothetical protein CLV67_14268 [Actinoplanes italicus]GIE35931.1 hypothetical protein Ait01nite_089760 [Actinoplanes italicus]
MFRPDSDREKPAVDDVVFVKVPHEPSADARRAAVLADRILTARARIDAALSEQVDLEPDDRDQQLMDLALDLHNILCLRVPGAPVPPVVPGPTS